MSKESITVKELRPVLQHFNESLGRHINNDLRFRLGKVLTLVDASIGDLEQRKAIKDIINGFWWSEMRDSVSSDAMLDPHAELRGLTEALGFELYPQIDYSVPVDNHDWAQGHAKELYTKIAKEVSEE